MNHFTPEKLIDVVVTFPRSAFVVIASFGIDEWPWTFNGVKMSSKTT